MAAANKKKRATADGTLSLRLSPRTKFAIELLAQKLGMSLSAVVTSAVEGPLRELDRGLTVRRTDADGSSSQVYLPDVVWHPLRPDRLVKLALNAPDLLTDEESVLWNVIQENPSYWGPEKTPNFERIRGDWSAIESKAKADLAEFGK